MTSATNRRPVDRVFLFLILAWTIFGLIMLSSASAPAGYDKFNDAFFFLKRQILYGLLPGLAALIFLSFLNYQRLRKISWLFYFFSLALLVLVFIPGVGTIINGSRSWLSLAGFTFQPSELMKLAVIVIAAHLLSAEKDLSDWKTGLAPILLMLSPAFILVLIQPDVGSLSILAVIILVLFYLAGVPRRFLAGLGAVGVVALVGLVLVAPYRMDRLTTFLHPELDPQGVGYHINQAFLAIGSGGWSGLGLGRSRQKFQYLPEVSADSIFAVTAEEMGFLVAAGLVILILLTGWRGLKIAKAAPDCFGRLLAAGVAIWFLWQSFLNIGAMVGILPLTGVPLPFVSHGGSALLAALSAAGVVISVSRRGNKINNF